MPNRLAQETSPYLLQHKDNPVDWHPWSDEAFELARAQNKPIFLSVGYSACHWCHVMERESFEDPQIANIMNQLFVNIKVDREERPDVDSIYMSAVQSMTGHGGWPMSVFLTPEGEPFYGGTYFPNNDRGAMPSFPRVLQSVANAYHTQKDLIIENASKVIDAIRSQTAPRTSIDPITESIFHSAYQYLKPEFDWQRGGIGLQPKFPQPMLYEFLLTHAKMQNNVDAAKFAYLTLTRMAQGGMYDQIGGGFHRYSVDALWLVPHFEKMLYDNAQLASLYLHAWQYSGNQFFKQISEDTLQYIQREMRDPSTGAFYSSTDADSEGEEGKFFVWHITDLREKLGDELANIAIEYWGVTRDGNFEGHNILYRPKSEESIASQLGISIAELRKQIAEARKTLYVERSKRIPPMTDDKVITSWNALTIKAFAEAAASLQRQDWAEVAVSNAEFILKRLVRADGRLMRTCKADSPHIKPIIPAYLEDYAYLADALLHLYQATFDLRWINEAHRLCKDMVELFWDEKQGVFYDTGADQESLVVRPRDVFDNAQPSGGSAAVLALIKCSEFTGDNDLHRYAIAGLRSVRDLMERAPSAFPHWLQATQLYTKPVKQVVIVGNLQDKATQALLQTARKGFQPDSIIALQDSDSLDEAVSKLPLFEGRICVDGKPTAYVCFNYTCNLPVTEPNALAAQLAETEF